MKADNIKSIIQDMDKLPYRAILFDGTWGIGKSYAINEALTENPDVCKISMNMISPDLSMILLEAVQRSQRRSRSGTSLRPSYECTESFHS